MSEVAQVAKQWLEYFNAGDVDSLLTLYADDCTHTSPKIRTLHPETGGKLVGKPALEKWWKDALKRLPGLKYEEMSLTFNGSTAVLEYLRHAPNEAAMPVAEAFDVRGGKIVASRVYHG